ncbi:probable cytochrome P450 4ac1 [Zeugodacus cucurbitae]|uniref:probable cytochrome P450 4ac1 n=1 Tax=Zeugodacus cucurbitae TaxID=28588 RepID=UPI0023D8FE1A|nr:probable cytochrome P450 4ac1 [Zeugodacus cucurbitae]
MALFTFILFFSICILGLGLYLKKLSKEYYLLAACKRMKTVDGSKVSDKVYIVPGRTIFGNNFDILHSNPEDIFNFCRDIYQRTKDKSYVLLYYTGCIYSITSPEAVQEVFQSQTLITKGLIYDFVRPFLGNGLLVSRGQHWHNRRKLLTPAFHFNILQSFNEVFKSESLKLVHLLSAKKDQNVNLNEIISAFTLNSVCETALGVSLDDISGSSEYRKTIHELELVMVDRLCNPFMYFNWIFYLFGDYKGFYKNLKVAHDFSSKIIQKKREEFQKSQAATTTAHENDVEIGKRKRYAMLDTLFQAESQGVIDHQGICDEVNTFMFEGYDTTATCLIFLLLNLAVHPDIQDACYREVKNCDLPALSIFEFNQLEYLECVIKETLRLYPSVPFIQRHCIEDTELNGVILSAGSQINIHIYDIMRDERHFPNPSKFDPDRFLPENSLNRHPFAFVPFSAGARNCIGQRFAMLEIKALLVGILQNFRLLPVTTLEDIRLENGLVLRTKENVIVRMAKRVN